jgi:hypothetical protein
MWKNFLAMPIILKLLTASALGMLLVIVSTFVPGGPIHVFGREMTHSEWWATGAGLITVVVGFSATAAAVLMLKRSSYGRPAYMVASAAMSISVLFVAAVTGANVAKGIPTTIGNLLLTLVIALYLYLSKGSRNYFRSSAL